MKAKYLLLTVALLAGCAPKSYTIEQDEAVYKQIGAALNQQAGYINVLVNEVFKKQITKCKAESKGLDLAKMVCVDDPKEVKK